MHRERLPVLRIFHGFCAEQLTLALDFSSLCCIYREMGIEKWKWDEAGENGQWLNEMGEGQKAF